MDVSIFLNICIFFKHVGFTLVVGYYLLAIFTFFCCILLTILAFIDICTGSKFISDHCSGNCTCNSEEQQEPVISQSVPVTHQQEPVISQPT